MTRANYIDRISRATVPHSPLDLLAVEEAMAMCLATAAIAHRGQPYSSEVVETIASRLLEKLEELLD